MADWGILRNSTGRDFLSMYNHDFSTTIQQMMGDLNFTPDSLFTRGSECDENTFCTADNTDECLSYLNQELISLGFQGLSYDGQNKLTSLINTLYELLRLHQKHGRLKEELENRLHRAKSECDHYQTTITRLKNECEHLEREISREQEKYRQIVVKQKSVTSKLKSEKDEVKRLHSVVKDRDLQYKHDVKKREREMNKLKEKIHHLLADKTPNRRVGLDMAYSLQSSDGRRSTWKTAGSSKQEEMYQYLISNYEEKQKELLVENTELRDSLERMQRHVAFALQLPDKKSSHLLSHLHADDNHTSDSTCSDNEADIHSLINDDSHLHFSSGYFQMPYDMIRENLENTIKERCRKLKDKKKTKRKLPSPKSSKTSPPKSSPIANGVKSGEKYKDDIDKLQVQINKYKDIIRQQEELIQQSIQSQTKSVEQSFLNDSQLLEEREALTEQKRLFYQEKANFEEERRQVTEAAIKLGRQRKAVEDEKASLLKSQFFQISPFKSSSSAKSTPSKGEGIRLLPSTPVFSPAPSGQPKTPSTIELFRMLGLTPKDSFLNRKSTPRTNNGELKKSLSTDSLLTSLQKTEACDREQMSEDDEHSEKNNSSRKVLFCRRRSSTGSNEDLDV